LRALSRQGMVDARLGNSDERRRGSSGHCSPVLSSPPTVPVGVPRGWRTGGERPVSAHAAGLGNGYSLQRSCVLDVPARPFARQHWSPQPAARRHARKPTRVAGTAPGTRTPDRPQDQNASFPVRHRTAPHRTAPHHRNAAVSRDSREARRRVVVATLYCLIFEFLFPFPFLRRKFSGSSRGSADQGKTSTWEGV